MLVQNRLVSLLDAARKHCDNTQIKDISTFSVHMEDIDDTTFHHTNHSPAISKKKRSRSPSTQESHHGNKKTTCNGKKQVCKPNIQQQKFSKTSHRASTTSAKVYNGFWTKFTKEKSKRLWWPTKIDLHDSELNLSNGLSIEREHVSSLQTVRVKDPTRSSLKTSWQSFTYSLAGRMVKEDTKALSKAEKNKRSKLYKDKAPQEKAILKAKLDQQHQPNVTRSRMLKLLLTQQQQFWMKIWFNDARKVYNQAIAIILRNNWHKPNSETKTNEMEACLVKQLVTAENLCASSKILLRTPKVIRQQAVKSAIATIKTFRTKYQKQLTLRKKYPYARKFQQDVKFQPKFKTKNFLHDSIHIEKKSGSIVDGHTCAIYKNWKPSRYALKSMKRLIHDMVFRSINVDGKLPNTCFDKDFTIHYKNGDYFLSVPRTVNIDQLNTKWLKVERDDITAVDPGVRKFATIYSPEGQVEFIGTNTNKLMDKVIRRIHRRAARLKQLKLAKPTTTREDKKKWRVKMQKHRKEKFKAYRKSNDVVKNIHYCTAHYLCGSYKTVIYPDFNAATIVKGKQLPSIVKKRVQQLRFGMFKERLKQVATGYNTTIYTGSEAYTSKQCGKCGHLNQKLGASEVFNCGECGAIADRDAHAARNILLRFLK